MIAAAIQTLGPWAWVILGLLLCGLELLAPGIFLIWLGLAALLTGLVDGLFDLSWQASSLVFAGLALISVFVGRRLAGAQDRQTDQPHLNHPAGRLVGQTFVLDQPIKGGEGRLRVNDSSWRITGPDVPQGAEVRVVRVDGVTLVVERVELST